MLLKYNVFILTVFLGFVLSLPAFAAEPSDNATFAADISGVWNTTDSCFFETAYTVILEQEAQVVTLVSTAGPLPSCNGTLSGNRLELRCAAGTDQEASYDMTGTVTGAASMTLSITGADNAVAACSLIRHTGLDPLVETMLVGINRAEAIKPLGRRTPRQMRRYVGRSSRWSALYPAAPVARIENIRIPGPAGSIPVRIYVPEGVGTFPVIVFYHGGGWVVGSAKQFDHFSRLLAQAASALVFAVDYRLAP
ncbi:MAG: alpha/beta hydrolase, partial [Deltaproteobacteria bacterium]|nr:alpha/beta hydrolase [Deltaproteobacteria bacterium]